MSKSSFLNNKNVKKSDIAIVCILIIVCGLLKSRFLLSVGMLLFGINALWNVPPRKWLQNKWWLAGVAWVAIYALSWFWSTNKDEWSTFLQLKLPILLIPLAFSFLPPFTTRQLQTLTIGIGALLLAGACYSVSFLVLDYAHYIQEYNVSHMLPTLMYGEYICFSTTCTLFIAWTLYLWPRFAGAGVKWFLAIVMLGLAAYLHILAAKSGLVTFYLFVTAWAVYTVFAKRSIAGILAVLAIPVFFYCAVTFIPTLRERKEHIVYTWYRYMDHDKSGKLGDLSRLISYDVAWKLIKEKPWLGVGTGDIMDEMNVGYNKWTEVTEDRNRLIPHNQFLTVGLGCGIPTMLLFMYWVIMPLFRLRKNRDSFFLAITWTMLLIMLLIEPFLEEQIGVCVYLLFPLLIMHVMGADKVETGKPDTAV